MARASNQRYLDALAVVEGPSVTARQLDELSQLAALHDRQRRGLNLMNLMEQRLFAAILCGANRLNGFRNLDIQKAL